MYNNITLHFSANCNMRCKYCDVNNSDVDLSVYNGELRENMENGNYFKNIVGSLGHLKTEIINLSLWGLEPTINIDLFEKLLTPLLDYYENCKEITFSTNTFLGYKSIERFIQVIDTYERGIKIGLQVSIDGPEWINDSSRRKGATERTIKFIEDTILGSQGIKNCTIEISIKPTLDCHFMDILNKDEGLFKEYFEFFYNLTKHYLDINHNPNIFGPAMPSPTIVVPHYHTVNDGFIFRDFIKNCCKHDNGQYGDQIFRQFMDRFSTGLNGSIDYSICSAGLHTVSVDYKGNVYGCHNLFTEAYDSSYRKSLLDAHTSITGTSKRELQKKQLLIHRYPESRESFMDIICFGLAKEGQINREYINDTNLRKLLYIITTGMYCCYGHLETTRSIWIPTTSYFKLLGNGAIEEMIRYYYKWKQITKGNTNEGN